MKRVITILFFVIIANSHFARAEGNEPAQTTHRADDKSWNFEFSPVTLIVGLALVEFGVPVTPNLTVGANGYYWNFSFLDTTIRASGLGGVVRYYFNGTYNSGWYAGGGLGYGSASAESKSSVTKETLTASASGPTFTGFGGYGWFWKKFYMRLGAALSYSSGDSDVKVRNTAGTEEKVEVKRASPGLEYNIGWAF